MRIARSITGLAVAGTLALGPAAVAGADARHDEHADPARMHAEMVSQDPAMARMHGTMMRENPEMGRMHGQMMRGAVDMATMHGHMMQN